MACRLDIRKTILDDINTVFIEGRYTYYRLNDDTFRVANVQETGGKSRAKSLNQAREIAIEVRNRILDKYGNNVMVEIIMPEYVGFPVELKVTPNDIYIEKLYSQVKPSKRTEYVSRLAFLQDPALFQQELIEDEPLQMIPYEAWAAQYRAVNPIIDEKGQIKFFQQVSDKGILASEKTIRDLAARMSDRIGIPFQIISDRTQKFKGKIENNVAIINLAYATLDTPIHEILGHPIIRTIKNQTLDGNVYKFPEKMPDGSGWGVQVYTEGNFEPEFFKTEKEAFDFYNSKQSPLYQNLLKELEYGKGKEVLDRVKKDYQYKELSYQYKNEEKINFNDYYAFKEYIKGSKNNKDIKIIENKYTLEEQQEEAIVELLGLYTAGKIDATKNLKLVSLLKQLLGRIKAFVRNLLFQKEVEIAQLPESMTIGDIADLLAYSNNKLILPGNEVVYTTPDNQQFKTYAEASKHISDLARSVEDVDLGAVSLDIIKNNNPYNLVPDKPYYITDSNFLVFVNSDKIKHYKDFPEYKNLEKENYYEYKFIPSKYTYEFVKVTTARVQQLVDNNPGLYIGASDELKNADLDKIGIKNFIEKNKEYEQSKEIIEEWKKVNNIQYNPEEIYSRGQEFTSVVGAYSNFDVNLMMQNLLQHIEDNEKAGGEFTISAFTKPVDRTIGHLEGGGGKIKFKIYPKSKDIKWAANTDVYSGSVWDASEKVSKDKKSELLGVSYSKYPSLRNINAVQPNLASIVDSLAHHHNELGITLTGNNFRLEYDEDIPYTTKKIIDSVNSILDQKYGKLEKPEITANYKWLVFSETYDQGDTMFKDPYRGFVAEFNSREEADKFVNSKYNADLYYVKRGNSVGTQPTQTNETLKESIDSIRREVTNNLGEKYLDTLEVGSYTDYFEEMPFTWFTIQNYGNSPILDELVSKEPFFNTEEEAVTRIKELVKEAEKIYNERKATQKEYTSQALINTKIAKLKEVAKKYPRSLIRSEVKPIFGAFVGETFMPFDPDELPFQKVPGGQIEKSLESGNTFNVPIFEIPDVMASILYQNNNCK